MDDAALAAMSLFAVFGGSAAPAGRPAPEPLPSFTPMMQTTRVTGKVEVEAPAWREPGPPPGPPLIPPGSSVKVVSGEASFETDGHLRLEADAGDSFRFSVVPSASGRSRTARLEVLSKGFDARAGETTLRLDEGDILRVTLALPGRGVLELEAGEAPFSHEGWGSSLVPGHALVVPLPETVGFSRRPVDVSRLKTTLADARGGWKAALEMPEKGARPRDVARSVAEEEGFGDLGAPLRSAPRSVPPAPLLVEVPASLPGASPGAPESPSAVDDQVVRDLSGDEASMRMTAGVLVAVLAALAFSALWLGRGTKADDRA